nr:SDR family NAD(P)-dependent oxidoreductase [Ruminiclostridium josui]
MKNYKAQVVLIGRRQKDSSIQAKLDRLAAFGPTPQYISADASDFNSLKHAYEEIKKMYPTIHGVIHSAILLLDRSLANMDEERFRTALAAKVDTSVHMSQVFKNEPLDFVLFFSSINSFLKTPGQSNYVAGCTFKDAFAKRLSKEWNCAVKVINWGYWGNVGVVASQEYMDRMAKTGFASIDHIKAMETLEMLLQGALSQLVFFEKLKLADFTGLNAYIANEEKITVLPTHFLQAYNIYRKK